MKKLILSLCFVFLFVGISFGNFTANQIDNLSKIEKTRSNDKSSITKISKGKVMVKYIKSSKGNYIQISNNKKISKFVLPYYQIDYNDPKKYQESFVGFDNISPSGKYISLRTAGYESTNFYILDTRTAKIVWQHYGFCNSIWSSDKQQIIVGCSEGMGSDQGLYINKKGDFPKIQKVNGDIGVTAIFESGDVAFVRGIVSRDSNNIPKKKDFKYDLKNITFNK